MHTTRSKALKAMAAATASMLLLMTGCIRIVPGGDGIVGSRDLETKEYDFTDFTTVEVGSAFEVEIRQSDTYGVSITLNENLFEYLDISRSGTTLRILMKTPQDYHQATRHASITMPELRTLNLLGANRGKVFGFTTDQDMTFLVTGASDLELADMQAGDTTFNVSGASRVTGSITIADGDFDVIAASTIELEGSGIAVDLNVVAASSARLERFPVKTATANVIAASNATLEVSDRMDIDVSAASRLVYGGDAILGSIQVSGGSTLSRR